MRLANALRRAVPAPLKRAIKRRLGMPLTRLHRDWAILEPIGPVARPHVIFDVGAHEGWFFHCWTDWCPAAEVHAFEPAEEAFSRSRMYENERVHLNRVAVGRAAGTMPLNVMSESSVSNSLLAPVGETWREIGYRTGDVSTREVEVITLDDYARRYAIDSVYLIKIDVQGFELEVLEGAHAVLKKTDYVFVEAAIRPLYAGAPRFTAVYDFLADHGFHLMTLRAWHRGNHVLVETDMLFRRNELMPPIDPSVDREYVQV
jgi:FkbM family methyltransferase